MMIIQQFKIESDDKPMKFTLKFVIKLEDPYHSVRLVQRNEEK